MRSPRILPFLYAVVAAFTGPTVLHAATFEFVPEDAACDYWVPTSGAVDGNWQDLANPANFASWTSRAAGSGLPVGYDSGGNPTYLPVINTDVEAQMDDTRATVYIRVPFTVDAADLAVLQSLALGASFDDGFNVWLNGSLVESQNSGGMAWTSTASASHEATPGSYDNFDISASVGLLQAGANVLAIQGLNRSTTSSDFLAGFKLTATDEAPPEWPEVRLTSKVTGIARPTGVFNAGDGSGRLFITEQQGIIEVLQPGASTTTTFLDIRGPVLLSNGYDERGLLGLAFHPDYANNGRFFVYYSRSGGGNHTSVIAEYGVSANPNIASTSEEVILTLSQPQFNHNGGDMHFGEDGCLYIGFGDGGGGGDEHGPTGNGQNPATFLGKMIRIDIDAAVAPGKSYAIPADNPFLEDGSVLDEIYAFGLRNPWRWSFDRKTGDMWIGDVGQNAYEEIDFVPAANTAGVNYGWKRFEALHTFSGVATSTGTLVDPIIEIAQGPDSSITGGFVYRGDRFPRMEGVYIFGDYNSGRLYGTQNIDGDWPLELLDSTPHSISSFGEDEAGNLYLVSYGNSANANGALYLIEDTRDANYLRYTDIVELPNGLLQITAGTEIGKDYIVQTSTDLLSWTDVGASRTAAGYALTFTEPARPKGLGRRYTRIAELP